MKLAVRAIVFVAVLAYLAFAQPRLMFLGPEWIPGSRQLYARHAVRLACSSTSEGWVKPGIASILYVSLEASEVEKGGYFRNEDLFRCLSRVPDNDAEGHLRDFSSRLLGEFATDEEIQEYVGDASVSYDVRCRFAADMWSYYGKLQQFRRECGIAAASEAATAAASRF